MIRKKKLTKEDVISIYMQYMLEQKKRPKTVASFIKKNNITDNEFDKHFVSLFEVEQVVFEAFFLHTLNHLLEDENYHSYEPRNKLLSFYYTFFEILSANEDYVKLIFNIEQSNYSRLKMLSVLRSSFLQYIKNLGIETINFQQENIDNFQQKAIAETGWLQFLFTLKFWLEDNSEEKEKTDILIEKAVNTTFDVLDTTALKSVIDLGKFLLKEKFNFNS